MAYRAKGYTMSKNREESYTPKARMKKGGGTFLTGVLTIAFVAAVGVFLSTTVACEDMHSDTDTTETAQGNKKAGDADKTSKSGTINKNDNQSDISKNETAKIGKETKQEVAQDATQSEITQSPAPQRVLGWQGGATVNYDNSLLRLDLIVNGERIDAREVSARTLKLVDVWSVDVQAVPSDSRVSVSGTGTQNLSEGPNTFGVTTTAPNGTTWYFAFNITVERAPAPPEKSHDATLASLGIFYGGQDESRRLSPAFSSGIFSYTLASEAWLGNFVFSPAPAHTGATFSSNVEGDRYTCTVTAEDGTTTNTYTITRTPPTPTG